MSRECGEMHVLIQASLDGELPASQQDVLQRHLDGCISCAADFAASRVAMSALSNLPSPVPPANFSRSVMGHIAAIRAERPGRRRWGWLLAGTSLAASTMFAAALIVVLGTVLDVATIFSGIIPTLVGVGVETAMTIGRGLMPIGVALAKLSSPSLSALALYYAIALGVLLLMVGATRGRRRFARIHVLAF